MTRVLVLDDDPYVLDAVCAYLGSAALDIIACQEIEAAHAMIGAMPFDVVITDLEVSEVGGIEGARLIRHVATHYPDTMIIAITGHSEQSALQLVRQVGASAVMLKPLDLTALSELVHSHCGVTPSKPSSDGGRLRSVPKLDEFLASGQMSSVLQPIVDGSRHEPPFKVHGYESLARATVDNPLRNPEILFSYAAHKERLFQADILCMTAALDEARVLGTDTKLFLNVQPRSLTNSCFVPTILELVEASGRRPQGIVFELTEQQTIINPSAMASALIELREKGFTIALDDYGVGFANLQLIHDLRPDYLKISGHFCRRLEHDPYARALVRSTAEMASDVRIPTILESVENEAEAAWLAPLRVTFGQGYFYQRPAHAADLLSATHLTHA